MSAWRDKDGTRVFWRRRKRSGKESERRERLVRLMRWTRHEIARVLIALVIAWLIGAIGIHFAERGTNENYRTWGESFWNVWVMMFSGVDNPPRTPIGRLLTVIVVGIGIGLVGLFTGGVASTLVVRRLGRREVSQFEMEDHLVLCNWASRGLEWIQEVHNKFIQDKRSVVVIHDNPEAIDLPSKQDDPVFNDVYIVKGDPTSEIILRRARVQHAHSVVVLSDDRQGEHADGKTILICIALRNLCKSNKNVNIAVECRNPANRHHLKQAGADEIISSDELGLRLLARTSLYHGMTRVYQELLTVGRDANEMYLLALPPELVGRDFVEISGMFLRHRDDRRSCLLIGVQRDEEMILNPVGNEAGPLKADDQLIVMSRVILNATQPLPTVPPILPRGSE